MRCNCLFSINADVKGFVSRAMVFVAGIIFLTVQTVARADEMRSELPSDTATPTTQAVNEYRILFIGNSITRHGTNEGIRERLKWDHVAGMAATSEDKDFAHILTARIQAVMPDRKVVPQFSGIAPGGKGAPEERAGGLAAKLKDVQADLVIFQHGEHEQANIGQEQMEKTYRLVLDVLAAIPSHPHMICVGNWAPQAGPDYSGWGKILNDTMSQVCAEKKIPFVSVQAIAVDPACRGWGEHPGVKWHPNDEGQRRYAEEIFKVWKKTLNIKEPSTTQPSSM